jgi:DNA-binding IclR family transcriptional regulator
MMQLHSFFCNTIEVAGTGQPSRHRVASTERSLAILDLLAEHGPLRTSEIARELGATPSTVSRQLGTFVGAGLVDYARDTRRYRLGIHLVRLANSVLSRLDIRAVAHPRLERLAAEVGETATLSVPGEPDAVTIDFAASHRDIQSVGRLGRPSIAHATAAGKAMLAFENRLPATPLRAYTPRTLTDVDRLADELDRIRRRGWADAYEEREPNLNAIAAPAYGSDGALAGIVALQGPVPRFGRAAARRALPALLEQAAEISRALGARDRP